MLLTQIFPHCSFSKISPAGFFFSFIRLNSPVTFTNTYYTYHTRLPTSYNVFLYIIILLSMFFFFFNIIERSLFSVINEIFDNNLFAKVFYLYTSLLVIYCCFIYILVLIIFIRQMLYLIPIAYIDLQNIFIFTSKWWIKVVTNINQCLRVLKSMYF